MMDWKSRRADDHRSTPRWVSSRISRSAFAIDRFRPSGPCCPLPTRWDFVAAMVMGFTAPGAAMFFFLGMMGLFQHCSRSGARRAGSPLFLQATRATRCRLGLPSAGRVGAIIGPATGSALMHLHVGALRDLLGIWRTAAAPPPFLLLSSFLRGAERIPNTPSG